LGALLVQVPATIKDVDDNCIATVVYRRGWVATPGLKKLKKSVDLRNFAAIRKIPTTPTDAAARETHRPKGPKATPLEDKERWRQSGDTRDATAVRRLSLVDS
jgi:hypothetical protein